MDRNSPNSQGYKLESQLRESYGNVIYTKICHDKFSKRLLSLNNKIKIWQIILSSVTTGSFVLSLISDEQLSGIIGSALSLSLLILNTFVKNFDIVENTQKHQMASNQLWEIGEEYISLLTDFESLSQEEIVARRDQLHKKTAAVYHNSPKIDAKSCKEAKKEYKRLEAQSFTEKEIDAMLPYSIRRRNREMIESVVTKTDK